MVDMIFRWLFGCVALTLFADPLAAPAPGAADEVETTDEKVLEAAGVGTDGAALLAFFRRRTLTEEDERRVAELVRQLGSERFEAREKASRALTESGKPALKLLRPALADPDVEVVRRAKACIAEIEGGDSGLPAAAARLLARRTTAGAVPTLLAYVPFADDTLIEEEVLAALAALGTQPGKVDPALANALKDHVPARRAAAAYVLGRHPEKAQREEVRPLLADPEPLVRFRAAQGLLAGKDRHAVPVLIALLADTPANLAGQAEEVLWGLAEDASPAVPSDADPAAARRKYRDAWSHWWRDHGKDVDLARLGQRPPYLGLTLIAQSSAGKVWECAKDGKPRWTISGLEGPIEALMLPGNRVLVVENLGKRVSERDLSGKVLWEHKTDDEALSARRLPNGHIFVATNSTVSEITRDGKDVYRHRFPVGGAGGRINSACKLRNGRLLVLTSDGVMAEVDAPTGKLLATRTAPDHASYSVEPLPGGGCLVAAYGAGKVVEYDAAFKSVWEYNLPSAFHALRLPNGHTLISSHSGKIVEVTRESKIVWEQRIDDHVWRAHRR
jgi:HEAT repeat protein/outer membrane protein assembly factor BamB